MDNKTIEKINEIRQNVDIVDVLSRHINVVKKGKNYFAICPFHNDTNPSLSISQDKQIFKCFVCNEAGNVFTFLQKYKRISYLQAVKEVADIAGIEFKTADAKPTEFINTKIKVLYDILKDVTLFYKNELFSSENALNYCLERKLEQNVIKNFNIGYSSSPNRLVNYLINKGYKKEDIYRAGIVIESNGELLDRFASRLIFPITDLNGNVVAFSGRIIEKSEMAKYVNSPETEIFVKGQTLYNYSTALPDIKKEKKMYICEGFMDCIALCKAGILNSVALMGTAFTKEHLKLFKYLGVEIVLVLDADEPGNTNAEKLANELVELNVNVKIIPSYKDAKDLDEFIVKYGSETLVNHLKESTVEPFEFSMYIAKKYNGLKTNQDKKVFLKKMCKRIASMSEEDIDLYSNKLNKELEFSSSTIKSLINEYRVSSYNSPIKAVKKYKANNKKQELQLRVLSQMLDSEEAINIFINELVFLNDESYRKIAMLISEYYKENKDNFKLDYLIADLFTKISTDQQEEGLQRVITEIDNVKDKYPTYNKQSFTDMLYELKEIIPLEDKIKKIEEELKFANSSKEKADLVNEALRYKRKIMELKQNKAGGK